MGALRSTVLGAIIDVQSGNSVAALGKVSSAFNQASQSAASMAVSGLRSLSSGFTMASIGAAGLSTVLLGIGAAGLKVAGDYQATEIAFSTMLGSAEAAKKFLGELQQFAASTPFEFTDLTAASRKMLALGFTTKDVIPYMTDIGNAIAGMSGGAAEMDSVVRALGKVRGGGFATAEAMNMLIDTGTFGWVDLGKAIGKTAGETMDLVTKKQIDANTLISAFMSHSQEKFGGLMEKQSHTFLGQLSNLKDAATQTMTKAFLPLVEAMTPGIELLNSMSASAETATQFGQGMGDAFSYMLDQTKALKAEWGGMLGDWVSGLESSGELSYELGVAAVAFTAITVAAVPVFAVLAGLAGAAAMFGEVLIPVAGVIALGIGGALLLVGGLFATAEGRGVSMFEVLQGWWASGTEAAGYFMHAIAQTQEHFGGFGRAIDMLKAAWSDITAAFGAGSSTSQDSINSLAATVGTLVGLFIQGAVVLATFAAAVIRVGTLIFSWVIQPLSGIGFAMINAFMVFQEVVGLMVAELARVFLSNPVTAWVMDKLGVDTASAAQAPAPAMLPDFTYPVSEEILQTQSTQKADTAVPLTPPMPPIKVDNTVNTSVNLDGRQVAKSTKKVEVELTERAGFSITPWQKRQILERGAAVLPAY